MTKEEFNKLEVLDQVKYINGLVANGKSLREISSDLGMSKTTFRDRFKKIGYIYSADIKQYCKENKSEVQKHESITKIPQRVVTKVIEPIKKENTKEVQKYNDDILELIDNKTELLEMLKDYKSKIKIIDMPQLNINSLPQELQTNIINKSIKVYEPVSKLFDEVCGEFGSIKKQDMLSLAMYEFYKKYKK